MTLGKKFLEDFLGMSSAAAATVNGAMLLTVTIGYMVGGFLPKLAGDMRKPFVIIASAATLAAAAMLYFGVTANLPVWWFVTAYVLLGATNSPAIVGTALMKEMTPPATAAFGISMLNAACYVAVAVASTVVGLVLDAYEPVIQSAAGHKIYPGAAYAAIFAGMAVLAILTTVVSFFVPETRGVQRGA
jgi:MFS family permease